MSESILQKIVRVGLLALFALLQASPAAASAPQRFVVFGDSLSDPGNAFVLVRDVEVPPFDNLIPDAPYARGALEPGDVFELRGGWRACAPCGVFRSLDPG